MSCVAFSRCKRQHRLTARSITSIKLFIDIDIWLKLLITLNNRFVLLNINTNTIKIIKSLIFHLNTTKINNKIVLVDWKWNEWNVRWYRWLKMTSERFFSVNSINITSLFITVLQNLFLNCLHVCTLWLKSYSHIEKRKIFV